MRAKIHVPWRCVKYPRKSVASSGGGLNGRSWPTGGLQAGSSIGRGGVSGGWQRCWYDARASEKHPSGRVVTPYIISRSGL